MRRTGWFGAEPGRVLKDALRAGVVDELFAADQPLLHRHPAPCAEAIGEISWWRNRIGYRWGDVSHVRHSPRPL